MPPKPTKNVSDWHQCVKCNCILHVKELSKHKLECETGKQLSHGHILDGLLHGQPRPVPDDKKIAIANASGVKVILLHPAAMQMCGLTVGGLCVVNSLAARISWPCGSIASTSVALREKDLNEFGLSGLVQVHKLLPERVELAGHLELTAVDRSPLFSDEKFVQYVSSFLGGQYVCVGAEVCVQYFGQTFTLTVSFASKNGEKRTIFTIHPAKHSRNNVVENLANLSLNDSVCNESSSSLSIETSGSVSMTCSTPKSTKSITSESSVTSSPSIRDSSLLSTPKSDISVDREHFQTPKLDKKTSNSLTKHHSKTFYKVTDQTKVIISTSKDGDANNEIEQKGLSVSYLNIGGMEKQISMLREMIETPLKSPHLFQSYGLPPPKGVLLFGPSGCGKSLLVQAVTTETNINVVSISGPEVWSKFYGETETKLKNLFQTAVERAPSLIVLEDVEVLCPRRDSTNSEVEKRVVASLLTLMDGISQSLGKFVLVLGTTSKPDQIDPALRRPGRFDREIEIGVPTAAERRQILTCLLSRLQHTLTSSDMFNVADSAHGYVGADLAALCKEASLHCMQRACPSTNTYVKISLDDMRYAMTVVQPSAMREVQLEVPKVLWSDIGGQDQVKLKLKQAVEWPLKHPEAFIRMGIAPPRGILMYGPPGCSKTMIAKALATESGLNFLAVKGPELFSKWVGESERAVREVFRKARAAAPSIVFFDEIDALAIERGSSSGSSNVADRVLAQLLTEIDGVEGLRDVTIVAATNRPDMIDKALMRPGRFDRVLYVPLPDLATRHQIFMIHLRKMPVGEAVTPESLAERTQGYSGAEIASVCHEAAMFALQEDIGSQSVEERHFLSALETVTPRIGQDTIKFYEEYQQKSGLHSV
ncbi:ribosome biogenesis protein SPATA5-like [Mya arenaria]|uniref:ribosome biogenesis protein SPATA5-like n=1 Tax=Mya arenaria TaxID=6604 RepID=UPI0022E78F2F|nr:ribosome biogenesis protein SPATA5-like [Mya arenaria]